MLENKIALVTGASRGIGRETAKALAREGALVIINYNGSAGRAAEAAEEIRAAGGQAETMQCNVADDAACKDMIACIVKEHGRLDILVNNAGITRDGLLLRLSGDDFDAVLQTNLKGAFLCTKYAAKAMLRQKQGRIISLSSVVGLSGNAGQTIYAASKAGIVGFTKAAAKELAGKGITVNAIAPGFIETEMTEALSESQKGNAMEQIPMKRFGSPSDIAELAVFLASDKASYITGEVIRCDGGMAM